MRNEKGSLLLEALFAGSAALWIASSGMSAILSLDQNKTARLAEIEFNQKVRVVSNLLADARAGVGACVLNFENVDLLEVPNQPGDNQMTRVVSDLRPNQNPAQRNIVFLMDQPDGMLDRIHTAIQLDGCSSVGNSGPNTCNVGGINLANQYRIRIQMSGFKKISMTEKTFQKSLSLWVMLAQNPARPGAYRVSECVRDAGVSIPGSTLTVDACTALGGTLVDKFGGAPGEKVCNVTESFCASIGATSVVGSGACKDQSIAAGLFGNFGSTGSLGADRYRCPAGTWIRGIGTQGNLICY